MNVFMMIVWLGFGFANVNAADTSCTYMANQASPNSYSRCVDCHYFFCPSTVFPRSREEYYKCDPNKVGLVSASLVKGKSVSINTDQLLSTCEGPNKKQSEKKLLKQYEKNPPKFTCLFNCNNPACPKELLPMTYRVNVMPEKHPEMKTFKDAYSICQGFANTDPAFDLCVGATVDSAKKEWVFDPSRVNAGNIGGCAVEEVLDHSATSDDAIATKCSDKCRWKFAKYNNALNDGSDAKQERTRRNLIACQERCKNKNFTR